MKHEGTMTNSPDQKPEKKKSSGIYGVALPAGLFIGMGVGFLIDELVASMFIGIGIGFLVMMVARSMGAED